MADSEFMFVYEVPAGNKQKVKVVKSRLKKKEKKEVEIEEAGSGVVGSGW